MTIIRIPRMWVADVLPEMVVDVLQALGTILRGIGRLTLRLLWVATVIVILDAIFMRATVEVPPPPVLSLGLTGAWLGATVLWLVGGLLRRATPPRAGRAPRHAGRGTSYVGAQRIRDWEDAWRRALRYQQAAGRHADGAHQRTDQHHRRDQPPSRWAAASPYEILGVTPGATQEQLRAAYRELAMRVHRDRNPGFVAEATERFAAIHAAYELLSEPDWRAAYDERSRGCQ